MNDDIPERLRSPSPRPWWRDNELTGQARSGYPERYERPAEWARLVAQIRAEIAGGAVYAADVVAMVRPTIEQLSYLEAA